METIKSKFYDIHFLETFEDIFTVIFEKFPTSQFAVVTDENISKLYLQKIEIEFKKHNKTCSFIVLPEGEVSKTRYHKEKAENYLFEKKFSRGDVIISIGTTICNVYKIKGGGVIGDFSGYLASTFMRGIKYVQVRYLELFLL
jgi:3-dehydroquinate synthetase